MVNVGPLEIMLVAIIALIVLGPARLPEVARSVGRGMREFRSALTSAGEDDHDEDEDDEIPAIDEEPPDDDAELPPLPTEPPGAAAEGQGEPDAKEPDTEEPAPGTPEDLPERG